MRKIYYIVESSHGCFGAAGTVKRLNGEYSSKKEALKNTPKNTKTTLYWVDFYHK
jgi:hypothetical protein